MEYWTACYTDRDGRQVKRSTKQTKRKDALTIALEFERVEQQARRGTMTRVQVQKVMNETVEKILEETIVTPSVEDYLRKDWLAAVKVKKSEATCERYGQRTGA